MAKDRAHDIHLGVASGAIASALLNFLKNGGGGAQAEPAAPIFLRDKGGEKAGFGEASDELFRIRTSSVELTPVLSIETGAQRAHRGANVFKCFRHAQY